MMGHVQAVVPVGAFQQDGVAGQADVEKGRQMLHEQVFENGAAVRVTCGGAQHGALIRPPIGIDLPAAMGYVVFEVGLLAQQEAEIARLIEVELDGQQRPGAVIHPNAGDVVAVGLELARLAADDGGVAAVDAHAGEVVVQTLAHRARFRRHEEHAKLVLPQIAPAAAAAAVVVIGQEGVAHQPAQGGLDRHPLVPQVEASVGGVEGQRLHLGLPMVARALQRFGEAGRAAVARHEASRRCAGLIVDDGQDEHVGVSLARRKGDICETQRAHGLVAVHA